MAIDHIRLGAATAMFDAIYLASRSLGRRQGKESSGADTDGGDTVSKMDYKDAVRGGGGREHCLQLIVVP